MTHFDTIKYHITDVYGEYIEPDLSREFVSGMLWVVRKFEVVGEDEYDELHRYSEDIYWGRVNSFGKVREVY